MPLATCARCNQMFNKVQSPVCGTCQDAEDADFEKIRKVIEQNENLNVEEVAEAADVEIPVVRRMVDEGLVKQVATLDGDGTRCGQCGAPAISTSKKLCQVCLDKLNTQMTKAQAQIKLGQRREVEVGEFANARKTFEEKRK